MNISLSFAIKWYAFLKASDLLNFTSDVDLFHIWAEFNLEMPCSKLYLANYIRECLHNLKSFIVFWILNDLLYSEWHFQKEISSTALYLPYNAIMLKSGHGTHLKPNKSFVW